MDTNMNDTELEKEIKYIFQYEQATFDGKCKMVVELFKNKIKKSEQ